MTSVITNLFLSVYVLFKGISLALLDMVLAVWHLIRDINMGFFHILQGIVGFLWSESKLLSYPPKTALSDGSPSLSPPFRMDDYFCPFATLRSKHLPVDGAWRRLLRLYHVHQPGG